MVLLFPPHHPSVIIRPFHNKRAPSSTGKSHTKIQEKSVEQHTHTHQLLRLQEPPNRRAKRVRVEVDWFVNWSVEETFGNSGCFRGSIDDKKKHLKTCRGQNLLFF